METIIPHEYDAIIFDLGGVILNIDYGATERAFVDLGLKDFEKRYSQAKQSQLFDQLETGKISPAVFRDEVRKLGQVNLSDEEIDRAWNAMLLDLPKGRVELLKNLSTEKEIYLLSNTNEIHYTRYHADLLAEYGADVLNDLFSASYFSHITGRRKPHPETFLWVCEQHGLTPSTTLFIDDSIQHIEGARKAGLMTYHKPGNVELETVIKMG